MELWWNLDILWWNLDRFEHKFDGKLTNWPCWSEGKLGTGPFTWLGQGFHFNFSEIPFQKRENLSIYGQNYGQLRSNGDFWRSCNRKKKGFTDTPVFCNASRNSSQVKLWVKKWKFHPLQFSSFVIIHFWIQCLIRARWGWKYSPWVNKCQIV